MNIRPTRIQGVFVVEAAPAGDHRGFLSRLYCEDELQSILNSRRIVQINQSLTRARGAVRGMHFQYPPHAEMKLVHCLAGRVFDVAVDLRRGSSTFLNWHAEILSPENLRTQIVPEGCAHGFQVLEQDSLLLYLHTARYEPAAEGGVSYADPAVNIAWPEEVTETSERDRTRPLLPKGVSGIAL